MAGKGQIGVFEGGDYGDTVWDQIGDKGRFAQAIEDKRVFLRISDVSKKIFDVGLQLGDKEDGLIWIRNVRFDGEEVAEATRQKWGDENWKRMFHYIHDPTLETFPVKRPTYNMEDAEPTPFQLQRGSFSADGEPKPIDLEAYQNRLRGEPVTGDQITAAPQQPPAAAPAPAPAPAPTLAPQPIPTIDLTPQWNPDHSPRRLGVDADSDEFTSKVMLTFAQIESSGGKFKRNKKSGSTATGTYQVTDGTATGPQPKELARLGLKPAKSTSMDDKDAYALDRVSALLTYFTGDLDKVAVAWYKGFSGAKKWNGKLKSLSAKERNYVTKWRKEYQRQL